MKVIANMTCPLCSKSAVFCFRSRDYNRKISEETFNYYRCPACGLIFISPVPANLGDYYPTSYYGKIPGADQLTAKAKNERFKIDIVQKFVQEGRFLEIGPAYSCSPWLAKQAGFEVDVIEMNPSCCRFWMEAGVQAINSNDIALTLKDLKSYHVITLWHVIEHLSHPLETLKAISEKILPGGILVIATPNPQAFQFHILGKYWPHVDAPRHLTLIPASLLIERMKPLGFKTAILTTTDRGSLGWDWFGWAHFFANMSPIRFIPMIIWRFIGLMVAIVMSPIERIEGKGSAYTLVLKKEAS